MFSRSGHGLRATAIAFAALGAGVLGCSLVLDFDLSRNARDLGADAAASDSGPADAGPCPGDGEMVEMTVATGQRFCVDRTEVSQRDYRAFVRATAGDAGGQPDVCFFNTTYTKAQFTEPADCTGRLDDEATADLPVTCIDWCDARAFCSWKGKRLCGKVGGGPVPFGPEVVNPAVDQWYAGCSSLGEHEYFYGDEYDPSRCNGGDRVGDGAGVLWEVGSRPECTGGPNGEVFDMIGNVGEFVDSCLPAPDGGPSFLDYCGYRGGTAGTKDEQGSHAYLRCGRAPPPEQNTAATRNYGASFIGFRCCADLP